MRDHLLRVGIDVGSTTTKLIVLDEEGNSICSSYVRHHADQAGSVLDTLTSFGAQLKGHTMEVALTGSGAKILSEKLGLPYIQEVVANAAGIRQHYPQVRTAIELGGQDAKIIFFRTDPVTGTLTVSDMRMNGSCAGGTGAFLDEMASILKVPVTDLSNLAAQGKTVYDISGRCGVYAKTDIQPLLNQGAAKEDLALSCLHAIAKQTIGGLAQGIPIEKPVIFEGGPLTYVPQLIRVFAERLNLTDEDIIRPQHPELMVAYGAALSCDRLASLACVSSSAGDSCPSSPKGACHISTDDRSGNTSFTYIQQDADPDGPPARPETAPLTITYEELLERLQGLCENHQGHPEEAQSRPYFASDEEYREFKQRHPDPVLTFPEFHYGDVIDAYLGIDSGSTTTKFVLMAHVPEGDCVCPDSDADGSGSERAFSCCACSSARPLPKELRIIDAFYSTNEGDPIAVACRALIKVRDRYREKGVRLNIAAACSTGYGELLFNKAFSTECHIVETVAHAKATRQFEPDATFLLDIGGQDMKAIWIDHGIITNIVVNEACSSGCGSFLQNFAESLHIPLENIAHQAFLSEHPASLGSRCTVFMNSSIVTEQRSGKLPADIMAGLCRSIIENVFTKVIRISNLESLGDHIVVQGGTFQNDAVLRAMEQYVGKNVTRAPYPGLMGAIGAAMAAEEKALRPGFVPTFIGLDALDDFKTVHEANLPCPFCGNHCRRSVVRFPNGTSWVTNNRCERGEVVGDPKDASVQAQLRERAKRREVPNLYDYREKLLFDDYAIDEETAAACMENREASAAVRTSKPAACAADEAGIRRTDTAGDWRALTVGIPRVLSFWDTMPFWSTFWRSLGFKILISDKSTRKMYENGLHAVTSDTMCFPAKLVHGHVRNLASKKVDFIFMPSITTMPSENREDTSVSMCALVKGFPLVLRNSDNPEREFGIPLYTPLFHWYTNEDRNRQLPIYMEEHFAIPHDLTMKAIAAADRAQTTFRTKLRLEGARVIREVQDRGTYAVVLASRPYHNDGLVNHALPKLFTEHGIPVLTADSIPDTENIDLSRSRIDVVNNYHARMLSSAVAAAQNAHLEYVQIVSFGCGHDAYLSDEIIRMMREISGKAPLILKLDESDVQGPLRIRVRSFIETIEEKRALNTRPAADAQTDGAAVPGEQSSAAVRPESGPFSAPRTAAADRTQAAAASVGTAACNESGEPSLHELPDPYPVKFRRKDKKEKLILVPNTSHAFSRIMAAAYSRQGVRTESLPIGRDNAIRLGKQYVHNDICFPAQIAIGEALDALKSGRYDNCEVAIGMARYVGDCRLTHYSALLRKALDDAGFENVPIVTNDDVDSHQLHPGFKMNIPTALSIAAAMPMIDELEELLRKIRPYEKEKGSADAAFEHAMDLIDNGLRQGGVRGLQKAFKKAIDVMKNIPYDRSEQKPRVLIVGEYLLNFHPGANHDIERYLESNGMEIIEARMSDVIQKTYFYQYRQGKEYHIKRPAYRRAYLSITDKAFAAAHDFADRISSSHPLFERPARLSELAKESDEVIPHTFDAGEGILIPGEIIHHARRGCKSFIILQPFGCLPNHVVGRGICRRLKEMFPDAQILPLDYDPDVSFANLENRLQMLIMNAQ